MIGIIYAIVIFIATFLGACAGLGGGVIIKPVLDFIGAHDLATISFLSASAVFTMSVYSTFKQIRNKVKFDFIMILLISVGAIVGGNVGSTLFNSMLSIMDEGLLKAIQATLLAGLLIIVLVNMNGNFKTYHIKNKLVMLIIGLVLGTLSSFLGIGGGPINVAVFVFFFSIATILFSQASKLFTIATTSGFAIFDLSLLFYTLPAAVLGGIVGTFVNKKSDEKIIRNIFNVTVALLVVLNIYNAVTALL